MPTTKPAICFVTNELYPLGPGGIGRMLFNFARHNEQMGSPAELHFLVPRILIDSRPDARELLSTAFEDIATIHVCPALPSCPTAIAQLLARAEEFPWTNEWLFADSYRYYLGLVAAEQKRGAPFDIIEFPDCGGWGVATIEAKRAGLAFSDTLIAARIHSTQGVLHGIERFAKEPGHWAGILFDAERHLFANADLVIGHDPAITAYTARFYGLEERWQGRSLLEFPPVFINTAAGLYERADKVEAPQDHEHPLDFIFASRLQPVKRPDIFIRAAILFLEQRENYAGTFRLVCNGWDPGYIDDLKSLVPDTLAARIIFMERAASEERLYLINHSIVVIPSDYESLCLFAFEAALAGRKVILNGTCPAFGNGFRWQDEENCLLFDGSVISLKETMEKALSWRASSVVDVVPSLPYWLDQPGRLLSAHTQTDTRAGGVSILCYGVQSPSEFYRHFDLACQLQNELQAAKIEHRVIFQLPRGSFVPGGSEFDMVHKRGWTCIFSSGNRECPQMFGHRIVELGSDPVFLFPFGFEASPSFLPSAIAAFRSNPALAIVSGHIELVDGQSGRSDYIRCYAGEAPSTALLSSRIAPSMCLLNPEVLRRIPFQAQAGTFWFEVFARTCALNGERIAIIPMIAGTLDSLMQSRLETTKRISAGLLDQFGLGLGSQARLLSVDPVQISSDADGRPHSYDADRLRQVFRINPSGRVRPWEPVGWHDEPNGVLIHPLDGEITIGEISGPYRRVSKVVGHVRNAHDKNHGAEVAIALARSHVSVNHLLKVIRDGEESGVIAVSAWTRLAAGAAARIEFPCYGASKGNDKILLISRPVPGKSDDRCEIIFTGIDLHFHNHSIG